MPADSSAYHTRTWLLWLATAGLAALLTRNPFYLALILAAAWAVDAAAELHQRQVDPVGAADDPRRRGWRLFVRIGIALAVIGALFNALAAHVGDTVLLRLPDEWPIVGGPITLEGLVYGAISGFGLVTLLVVAATFSAGCDTYALLRASPPFLQQAGVITSIGLAYVPQTLARAQEIREAQVLRGHRFRGARDVLPLAVPLLAGGLERALQLAEAMESRGYTQESPGDVSRGLQQRERPEGTRLRRLSLRRAGGFRAGVGGVVPPFGRGGEIRALLTLGAIALAIGSFLALFFRSRPEWGWAAMIVGGASVGLALYLLSRRSRRTHYRRQLWRPRDTAVCIALVVALSVLLATWLLAPATLAYSPYPTLTWPDFYAPLGLALALLAAPAIPLLVGSNVAAPADTHYALRITHRDHE